MRDEPNNSLKRFACVALALAGLALAVPRAAEAACVGVVPVLIGPLQVLLAVLPALLAALGGALLAMFKPAAVKTAARVLWRNKVATACIVGGVVGLVYAVPHVRAFFGPEISQDVASGGEWTAFHGGPGRRGLALGSADPTAAGPVWAFSSESSTFYSSPAVVGNRVYVTSANKTAFGDRGGVYCLDADTGAVVWKHSPSGFRATFSSPAVAEGYVVVGEGLHEVRDGRITCLQADTGKLVWERRAKSHVESSPCLYKGKAYIGAGDDGLYCLSLQPGPDGKANVLWHLDTKDYPDCEACPIAHDGKVYVGLGNKGNALACVDAETGKELWRTATPFPVFSSPAIGDGKVFVGMGNGDYIKTAEELWKDRLDVLRKQKASPEAIAAERKKFAPAGEIWALDLATGKRVWQLTLKDTVLGALAVAERQVYFGCRDGTVTCADTRGAILKQWNAKDSILASLAVGKEMAVVMTGSGRLLGLDRRSLKPLWDTQIDKEDCISSPAIGGGHVYVGTKNKGLVCFGRGGAQEKPVWAGHLGGAGRSGWTDGTVLAPRGKVAWQYPPKGLEATAAPAAIPAPAAYLDGNLYIAIQQADRKGVARLALGVNPQEAPAERWFYACDNAVVGSAALAGPRVYFVDGRPGDKGRALHAVEAASGKRAWTLPVADDATGELVLAQDRLLVRDGADRLSAIDLAAEKPAAVWRLTSVRAVGAPAVVKGVVFVASDSAGEGLAAFDLADGTKRWQRPLPARATTGPVGTEDFVAVGTESGLVVSSAVDGSPLWSAACGPVRGVLVCDDDRLACTTAAGEIVVLDWFGAETRRLKGVTPGLPPMLCGEQIVYLKPGAVERVDLASGKDATWLTAEALVDVAGPPILVNAYLYFPTKTRGLLAAGPGE